VILALETSCDETAAALVSEDGEIVANVVASQADLHARYGGVVPEARCWASARWTTSTV
jgi:N6-L-threonylcarbamoyladenine synthase